MCLEKEKKEKKRSKRQKIETFFHLLLTKLIKNEK